MSIAQGEAFSFVSLFIPQVMAVEIGGQKCLRDITKITAGQYIPHPSTEFGWGIY